MSGQALQYTGSQCERENTTPIRWLKANDCKWKALNDELSFIVQKSLRRSIRRKLHSFTEIFNTVWCDYFDTKENKECRIRIANRSESNKEFLKMLWGNKELIKAQFKEIKVKFLVISLAETTRKWQQEKRTHTNSQRNCLKRKIQVFTQPCCDIRSIL